MDDHGEYERLTAGIAGELTPLGHRIMARVYFADTDFSGVVYHARYLEFFERGRSDFLRVVGIGHAELLERPDPAAFAVVRMEVDYKAAARIDDALLVRTTYDVVKGPRMFISQRITRGEALICQAQVVAACIDLNGRARKPPPGLVERLSPLFA